MNQNKRNKQSQQKRTDYYQHDKQIQRQADQTSEYHLKQSFSLSDIDPGHTVQFQASTTYQALKRLAFYYHLQVPEYKGDEQKQFKSQEEVVNHYASNMGLRIAQVKLEGLWWKKASVPLLVFDSDGEMGVLYPQRNNTYAWIHPETGDRHPLTDHQAQALYQQAFTVTPQVQSTKPLSFKHLLPGIFLQNKTNMGWLLSIFFLLSLLGLVAPIVTGIITKHAIADANYPLLWSLVALLIAIAISTGLFMLVRTVVLVRLQTRANYNLQNIVMDRILKLPFPFFSPYQSGDLANRVLSVDKMVKSLTGANIDATLTFAFSFVSFGLMFYYAPGLSIITLIILGLVLLTLVYLIRKQVAIVTQALDQVGYTFGFLLQMLKGIARIKTFAKESVLQAEWAERYSRYRRLIYHAYIISAWQRTIIQTSRLATLICLFFTIAYLYQQAMPLRAFITFFSAYSQFMTGFMVFANTLSSLIVAAAHAYRLQPILRAEPESHQQRTHTANTLKGAVTAHHVTFRYQADSPPVVDNLSLHIQSSEFVALVGLSGCGKTTLIRLLLGFYTAESGNILFDDENIKQLNLYNLRQQIGVVLQDGQMMGSTLLEHIIGNASLNEDDAWWAAEQIGLDQKIRNFPMGMHTPIVQAENTFSGGERQLLLLARAIAPQPSLLILDEPTSGLDNQAQKQVMACLCQLNITRIIITHRLSLLKKTDKIYVMEEGQITQSGSYQQLKDQQGLLKQLLTS